MKTKAQEMAILQRTITELGPDTYLGPWLKSLLAELERDLRCDLFPLQTLAQAKAESNTLLEQARATCIELKTATAQECAALRTKTAAHCDRLQERCASELYAAIREVSR